MVPHYWPAVPDVIWHIYSHLECSMGDGGRQLPSSEEAALMMGQVPCEFWADWPRLSFLGKAELRGLPALPCPGWCLINGQWLWMWFGTFTHAWPAPWRIVLGTYHIQGRWSLVRGRFPVSFKQIGLGSVFRGIWTKGLSSPAPPDSWGWCTAGSSICNLAHLLAPVLLLKGGW